MDSRLAESFVNRDDHRVLGRRLHDFCLYDALFLSIDQNPIWTRSRDVRMEDLRQAVIVCSTPPEVLLRARRPLGWWRTQRWLYATRKAKLVDEFAKFTAYIADFDSRPVFWEDDQKGESLRAPWVLSTLVFLEDHTNMTEREILTAPLGKMLWKAAALAEQLGLSRDDIMTEEEENAMKQMGIEV